MNYRIIGFLVALQLITATRANHGSAGFEDNDCLDDYDDGNHSADDDQEYECRNDRYRQGNMEVVYSWRVLKYNIPRRCSGLHLPSAERQYISGLSVTKDRIFLSPGGIFGRVPVTFATVPKNSCTKSPLLEPYPNFDWHVEAATGRTISDCRKAFVTVYRSRLDSCGRLWVIDTGKILDDDNQQFHQLCPPKIVIFNITTDKPVRTITIPPEVYVLSSGLTDLVLDEQRNHKGRSCDKAMVYIQDTFASAVVVYDSANNLFSRVTNEYLQPDPDWGIHYVAGERYTEVFGVIALTLRGDGKLYLQPFASNKVYSVQTSDLQDSLYATYDPTKGRPVFVPVTVEFEKPCTAVGMNTLDRDGTLLYGPLCEYALYAWDAETNTSRRVTPRNKRIVQVIEDIKPDDQDPNKVWFLTTREQKYFRDEVNPYECNQRVILADLSKEI